MDKNSSTRIQSAQEINLGKAIGTAKENWTSAWRKIEELKDQREIERLEKDEHVAREG